MAGIAIAQSTTTRLVRLAQAEKDEVADLFARVFAGPPWFEVKKCSQCSEAYGKDDDLERFHDGDPCRRCGAPLNLVDYWRGGPALEVYEDALAHPGFIGMGARDGEGRLVGITWGYPVPETDTPSVHFGAVAQLLRERRLDPAQTFYAAETGVDPDYQGLGVGSRIMRARLLEARDAGLVNVCFRTINPKLVGRYEQLFGEDYVRPLFNDPDPVKSDRTWYACPFATIGRVNPPAVDRLDEYKIVLDDINRLSDRRQRSNDVFIALNGLFLTALGILLFASRLTTWWVPAALVVVSVVAVLINVIWLRSLRLYRRVSRAELQYANGLESLLRQSGAEPVSLGGQREEFGVLSLVARRVYGKNANRGFSHLELLLASSLTLAYPILTLLVAALTYLITHGFLPPLSAK